MKESLLRMKLDYFCLHAESELDFVSTSLDLHFICEDHKAIVSCEDLECTTQEYANLYTALCTIFEKEIECWFTITHLSNYKHIITIINEDYPDTIVKCDRTLLKELEQWEE